MNGLRRVNKHAGYSLHFSNGTQGLDRTYAMFFKRGMK